MRTMVACAVVLLGAGCEPGPALLDEPLAPGSAAGSGSAGGFSASLGAELARGSGTGTRDSAAASRAAGSGAAAGPGAGSGAAAGPGAGSGAAAAPGAGAAAVNSPVQVPPELAAIKLALPPSWERDVGAAGTISRELAPRGGGRRTRFTFHYGYDDPRAPTDRDAYKKFLGQARILAVASDRQRGAAWLLVGKDARGRAAFRVVVSYGGKRLVCHGSMYKHAPLGDARDEVVVEAQKICESLAL